MRAVIQRVSHARLTINQEAYSSIGKGLLVLLGVEDTDLKDDAEWLAKKITQLRIFPDDQDMMNLGVKDIAGEIMVVSQFTLHAGTKKGNRPSFIRAARPDMAIPLYEYFISCVENHLSKKVKTGKFGAMMDIELTNSGPATLIIDTKNKE